MTRAYGSQLYTLDFFMDGLKSIPTKCAEPTALGCFIGTVNIVARDFNPGLQYYFLSNPSSFP